MRAVLFRDRNGSFPIRLGAWHSYFLKIHCLGRVSLARLTRLIHESDLRHAILSACYSIQTLQRTVKISRFEGSNNENYRMARISFKNMKIEPSTQPNESYTVPTSRRGSTPGSPAPRGFPGISAPESFVSVQDPNLVRECSEVSVFTKTRWSQISACSLRWVASSSSLAPLVRV